MAAIDSNSNTEKVINITSNNVRFEIDGTRFELKPSEQITINRSYALPRHFKQGKDPVPSVIELLTGGMVLHVGDKRARSALSRPGV